MWNAWWSGGGYIGPGSTSRMVRQRSFHLVLSGRHQQSVSGDIVILFEIRTLRPCRYYYISIFFHVLQLL
jgi:hypothetical protein